jgi:hypothetical protein
MDDLSKLEIAEGLYHFLLGLAPSQHEGLSAPKDVVPAQVIEQNLAKVLIFCTNVVRQWDLINLREKVFVLQAGLSDLCQPESIVL